MDDSEFIRRSDECLQRVARWLEGFDPDEVDYSSADGSVTIEFPDGARFILSRQSATRQVWLAAGAHGWHFDWDAKTGRWVDDKDGRELYARLASAIAEKLGHDVEPPA
ncbi:MAG TPA: iron donor protein CyaY [Candidatus Binataceae bacterium]|nr:iron donor protein CyaY [Candidatus Binataceae bacterium]